MVGALNYDHFVFGLIFVLSFAHIIYAQTLGPRVDALCPGNVSPLNAERSGLHSNDLRWNEVKSISCDIIFLPCLKNRELYRVVKSVQS